MSISRPNTKQTVFIKNTEINGPRSPIIRLDRVHWADIKVG